ncbi:FAD-dependent oxidoreductase [Microbulbifer epialgicus]|uniref:FAD-dependent oxidoreductase n=1 Tax=Microbulbifer epialgicus TaxID=393907 RepID=A0ABV4P518_9GAMM
MSGEIHSVKLFGRKGSTEGYSLREFLQRHVVSFEWIEIASEETCLKNIGISDVNNVRFPVVQFADGSLLFNPSVRDVANRLGYIALPRLKEYDVSIYGAGPAGLSAAVYAASEGLSTVVIERHAVGGQAGTSSMIENYMGFPRGISGAELADRAREQALKFGAEIILMSEGIKGEFKNGRIHGQLADGSKMLAKANICATGVEYRRLELDREEHFLGKGVFYGAGVAEAPLCKGETIYIVGGANSAGQAAMHIANFAENVVMLVRGSSLKGTMSKYLSDRVTNNKKIDIRFNSEVTELIGDEFLSQIKITDNKNKEDENVDAKRLFVAIGGRPNTEWAIDTPILRDEAGYLVTGPDLLLNGKNPEGWPLQRQPYYLETSYPGSFAAGDVRHNSIKRAAAAAGEGAMAITFVYRYLNEDFDFIVKHTK